ncbi:unnamed protein product [Brassicogethes aeneus]|uniref:Ferritin n=1 Tax=Brassicogethes aeneus TaxID=1431903 RepID=A0A9P0FJI0_BRAAE|nr:unnamed protein product [Brassicogethes aeneus]
MKSIVLFSIVLSGLLLSSNGDSLECSHSKPSIPEDWIDMAPTCTEVMKKHIQAELNASMQYLAMAAHFSQDSVNRPGFAKMFFQSASEERDHAIKLISYLIMRGELTQDISQMIKKNTVVTKTEWASGVEALKQALVMEANVTAAIRRVIKQCEDSDDKHDSAKKFNDYHVRCCALLSAVTT